MGSSSSTATTWFEAPDGVIANHSPRLVLDRVFNVCTLSSGELYWNDTYGYKWTYRIEFRRGKLIVCDHFTICRMCFCSSYDVTHAGRLIGMHEQALYSVYLFNTYIHACLFLQITDRMSCARWLTSSTTTAP